MGSQVTVKLDARLAYALLILVIILGVVGIFGVGWWLGTQINRPAAGPAMNVAPGAVGSPAAASGQPSVASTPAAPIAEVARGVSPVSVEDVPVGENQPRIWIDELSKENGFVYDLGRIDAYAVTEKAFTIRNLGNADLIIDKVSATCGCTAAVLESNTVPPGGTTTIRVTYDPNVNQEQGKFIQKQIQIKSNDPVAPLIEFAIEADVASQ